MLSSNVLKFSEQSGHRIIYASFGLTAQTNKQTKKRIKINDLPLFPNLIHKNICPLQKLNITRTQNRKIWESFSSMDIYKN